MSAGSRRGGGGSPRRVAGLVLAGLTVAGLTAGCSSSSTKSSSDPASGATSSATTSSAPTSSAPTSSGTASGAPAVSGSLTVLAAASLKASFTKIGADFANAHPGAKVTFSFGGSSQLATTINGGAPADVFAAASTKTMATVVDAGNATAPADFATNTMEVATAPGNPGHVTALADLAKPSVKVAVCQVKVPCGAAATALFSKAGITVKPVTLEPDVSSTLQKISSGEVDAGIVYVTDVKAAGTAVHGIVIPAASNVVTTYPIAALKHARNPAAAAAFAEYVRSSAGQSVLKAAGFSGP